MALTDRTDTDDAETLLTAGGACSTSRRHLVLMVTAAGTCLGLLALLPAKPRLVWNYTESVPLGLYWITDTAPALGDVAAVKPTDAIIAKLKNAGVRRPSLILLKPIAAARDDVVCRHGDGITVNGRDVGKARVRSADGRALPAWSGCQTLAPDQVFVLSGNPQSFDSRYFGPISTDQILGVANPVLLLSTGETH